jgi:putative cell wall-binding protein
MEKDSVLLDLKTYNELRDFKKHIKDGNTCVVNYGHGSSLSFIGTDEALKEMSMIIQAKTEDINHLNSEIYKLKYPTKKQLTVNDIKAMGWWDLIKWKARNI